ncbi:MAG: hypothetical protein QHI38_04860 [Armatimonadota bacterium]|nr:hypothetical protein [Armatimonadota bacterium]
MDVFQSLSEEIEQIPAIDVHTHIRMANPAASDLAQIALYHFIMSELESAGISLTAPDTLSPQKKLVEASVGFPRIRNTASCWCLEQILRDLFDLPLPHESDIEEAFKRVDACKSSPNWTGEVMRKANVSKALSCEDWRKPAHPGDSLFAPVLRVDDLINEAHSAHTLDQLSKATGHPVYEAGDLKKAVGELVENAKKRGVVALGAAFEPQIDFGPGDRVAAGSVMSLALLGQKITREDRKTIRSYVLDVILQSCAEHELPFQLMLGIRHIPNTEHAITGHEVGTAAMYADLFKRHSKVVFDVLVSHAVLAGELAVVARSCPNVVLSGAWWYLAFPSSIRRVLRERIEMLPMTKCCGFFSDAQCVEWIYGRAKLFRKELAVVLSQLASEGYLSRDDALKLAHCYLHENPKRVYKL